MTGVADGMSLQAWLDDLGGPCSQSDRWDITKDLVRELAETPSAKRGGVTNQTIVARGGRWRLPEGSPHRETNALANQLGILVEQLPTTGGLEPRYDPALRVARRLRSARPGIDAISLAQLVANAGRSWVAAAQSKHGSVAVRLHSSGELEVIRGSLFQRVQLPQDFGSTEPWALCLCTLSDSDMALVVLAEDGTAWLTNLRAGRRPVWRPIAREVSIGWASAYRSVGERICVVLVSTAGEHFDLHCVLDPSRTLEPGNPIPVSLTPDRAVARCVAAIHDGTTFVTASLLLLADGTAVQSGGSVEPGWTARAVDTACLDAGEGGLIRGTVGPENRAVVQILRDGVGPQEAQGDPYDILPSGVIDLGVELVAHDLYVSALTFEAGRTMHRWPSPISKPSPPATPASAVPEPPLPPVGNESDTQSKALRPTARSGIPIGDRHPYADERVLINGDPNLVGVMEGIVLRAQNPSGTLPAHGSSRPHEMARVHISDVSSHIPLEWATHDPTSVRQPYDPAHCFAVGPDLKARFAALLRLDHIDFPEYGKTAVQQVIARCPESGYDIFIVGGAVRDVLLGLAINKVNDIDLLGTAPFRVIRDIISLPTAVLLERLHPSPNGVFSPTHNWQWGTGYFEYALPKRAYLKDEVSLRDFSGKPDFHLGGWLFGGTLEEDCSYRDLTINSLFFDPHKNVIIDPTGFGLSDLGIFGGDLLNDRWIRRSDPLTINPIQLPEVNRPRRPNSLAIQNLARVFKALIRYIDDKPSILRASNWIVDCEHELLSEVEPSFFRSCFERAVHVDGEPYTMSVKEVANTVGHIAEKLAQKYDSGTRRERMAHEKAFQIVRAVAQGVADAQDSHSGDPGGN